MLTETVHFHAAFLAGLLSFFSPCILPILPAYFTFITGFSLEELINEPNSQIRKKVLLSTLVYVCGFSFVFILLGASASYIGMFIAKYSQVIRVLGGIIIILFGVHLTGILRIQKLNVEKRIHFQKKPLHLLGIFLVGMAFAAGWSPCIGPLLGSILVLASNQESVREGIILLTIYSSGIALPFLILSFFIQFLLIFMKKAKKVLSYINVVAGMLLILIGLLLIFDRIKLFSNFS
ncbi:MAG: sulfite exporter TauE/SafE family protein [Desulfobacterales bacterium]|nr:sulfite exporter TauE/SafE family protein [Desulfobacterales bacterium]